MKATATTYKPRWLTLAVVAAGLLLAAATLAVMAQSAQAAFPGANGAVVFVSNRFDDNDDEGRDPADGIVTQEQDEEGNWLPPVDDDAEIYLRQPDGTVLQLTYNETYLSEEAETPTYEDIEDLDPVVSPDGKQIAFTSNMPSPGIVSAAAEEEEETATTDREVYVITNVQELVDENADGVADNVNIVQLTDTNRNELPNPALGDENEPTWAPGGKRIAFRVGAGQMADIYVVNVATKEVQPLIELPKCQSEPMWSPDGTQIVYRQGTGIKADLYLFDLATKQSEPIAAQAMIAEASPNWSPDGKMLVFRKGDESAGARIVVISVADGKVVAQVPDVEVDEGYGYSDRRPAFSPNGNRVVFESNREFPTASSEHEEEPVAEEPTVAAMPEPTEVHEYAPTLLYTYKRADGTVAQLSKLAAIEQLNYSDMAADWQPVDLVAPTIKVVRPEDGAAVKDLTPTMVAKVRDDTLLFRPGITFKLDGKVKGGFSYDYTTGRVTFTPKAKLALGKHYVRVVAVDSAGHKASELWSFKVVK